jgi:hypothetical protein
MRIVALVSLLVHSGEAVCHEKETLMRRFRSALHQFRNEGIGIKSTKNEEIRAFSRTNVPLVRSRFQDYHAGMWWYDAQLVEEEPTFNQLFHDIWKLTFTPSPNVRTVIETEMQRMGLKPGAYTAAHLRVLYAMKDRSEIIKRQWAKNALNCASELRPQTPIFFTSDSSNATYYAKLYATEHKATLATRIPNPNPPLHLDKVPDWRKRPLSDFYDAFVDLYILAQADCVTYNKGGYGLFGLLMSRNASCGVRQDAIDRNRIFNPCHWVDDPLNGTQTTRDHYPPASRIISDDPVYLEPMEG